MGGGARAALSLSCPVLCHAVLPYAVLRKTAYRWHIDPPVGLRALRRCFLSSSSCVSYAMYL